MRLGFYGVRRQYTFDILMRCYSCVQNISPTLKKKMSRKLLFAFDFDHTIVDGNTDVIARNLISSDKIPQSTKELYRKGDWIDYMEKIFEHLHQEGITREKVLDAIRNIPAVPGMLSLLRYLERPDCENIIISDANSVFISTWLKAHSLSNLLRYVYTNPADFDASGQLHVSKYQFQDWCELSSVNMCKRDVLQTHINSRKEEGVMFSEIVYVGDGHNDYCPCLCLSASDNVFVRRGFTLEKVIRTRATEPDQVKAKVHLWTTGGDILDVVKNSVIKDEVGGASVP